MFFPSQQLMTRMFSFWTKMMTTIQTQNYTSPSLSPVGQHLQSVYWTP